jgi:carbon-monoxide dehydrogenase large subunit
VRGARDRGGEGAPRRRRRGGGFGIQTGLYPEDIVVAYAARHLQRPVKWTAERIEEFLAATHGRDVRSHAELALDADGKVLGYRVRSFANLGAYAGTVGMAFSSS